MNSSSFYITYSSSSIDYTNLNQIQSYLQISVKKLGTYSSYIKYIDLYKNPGTQFVGRFPVVANQLVQDGIFSSLSDFTNYWTITLASGNPVVSASYDNSTLYNSIHLQKMTSQWRISNL